MTSSLLISNGKAHTANFSSRRQFSMKKTTKSVERLQDMLKHASRKRKRDDSHDNEAMTSPKRPRLMDSRPPMPRTFYLKVKQWHDRQKRMELGKSLYREAQKKQMVDQMTSPPVVTMSLSEEALDGIKAAENLIQEISHLLESTAPNSQIIKRLDAKDSADDKLDVKVVPVKRRGGFRKKGEKRLSVQ